MADDSTFVSPEEQAQSDQGAAATMSAAAGGAYVSPEELLAATKSKDPVTRLAAHKAYVNSGSFLGNAAKGIAGVADEGAHIASSGVAALGGGLTYLGTLAATGGDTDAAKSVQEDTQDALTYKNHTEVGKGLDEALNTVQQATTGKATDVASDTMADKFGPAAGAATRTALEGAPYLIGEGMRLGRGKPGYTPPDLPSRTISDAPDTGISAPGAQPRLTGPIQADELNSDPLQIKGPQQTASAPSDPTAGPPDPQTPPPSTGTPPASATPEAAAAQAVAQPDATFENTPEAAAGQPPAPTPPQVALPPAAPVPAAPAPAAAPAPQAATPDPAPSPQPAPAPAAPPGPQTSAQQAPPPGPAAPPPPNPQAQTGPTGEAPAPLKIAAPSEEGAVSQPMPPEAQAARKTVLQALNKASGGLLPETRVSAITGAYPDTATDYAHSKLNDTGGRRMSGVLADETNAMRAASQKLVDDAGGPATVQAQGQDIDQHVTGVHGHFVNGAKSFYATSDKEAAGKAIQLPSLTHLASNPAYFSGSIEGEALHRGLKQRLQAEGFLPSTDVQRFVPGAIPTVKNAEALRQWLGDDGYTPKTGKKVAKLKDMIDDDVAKQGSPGIYKGARNMVRIRNKMLVEPNLMHDIRPAEDSQGLNRQTAVADLPDKILDAPLEQFNHYLNMLHSSAQLGGGYLKPAASKALNALRSRAAIRLHNAGTHPERGTALWDPKGFYQEAETLREKLPALFRPNEIQHIRMINSAGNILRLDRQYKGASTEEHNTHITPTLGERGRAVAGVGARMVADLAAEHLLPGFGPAVMESSGASKAIHGKIAGDQKANIASREEAARAAIVEKRIVKLDEENAPKESKARGPGGKQRGGPKFTPKTSTSGMFHDLKITPTTEDLEAQKPSGSSEILPGIHKVPWSRLELSTPVGAEKKVPGLMAAIKQSKTITPVLVHRDSNGVMHVREGLHRAHALARLGYKSVPAYVVADKRAAK